MKCADKDCFFWKGHDEAAWGECVAETKDCMMAELEKALMTSETVEETEE